MHVAAIVVQTILLLGQAPPSEPPPAGLILGRVVDAGTNRPVAGAIVAIDNVAMVMPGAPPRPTTQPRAMTNANGHFVFRKLPKGSFGLTVTRNGYAEGAYGRRRPGGSQTPVDLEAGQRIGDIVIRVWRHASIAGTVVDEAGEPQVGVQVRVFMRRLLAGRRRFTQAGTASTDDRGVYRFGNLAPGEYTVAFVSKSLTMPASAAEMMRNAVPNDPRTAELTRERSIIGASSTPPGSPTSIQAGDLVRTIDASAPVPPSAADARAVFIYPTQFHPGVAVAARATIVSLESGQQRENVDFTLRPVRAARVSGLVVSPDGPASNAALQLVPIGGEAMTELETSSTIAGGAGEFTFLGVPPGQYALRVLRVPRPRPPASPPALTRIQTGTSMMMSTGVMTAAPQPVPVPDDPTMFADVPVSVAEADVTDVLVTLQKGARVTGRYEFDGTHERPDPAAVVRYAIVMEQADALPKTQAANQIPLGRADETGAFKTYGLPPGRYLLRMVGTPPGWTMKSAISEGRDISDTPIDLKTADLANVIITFTDRPTKLTGIARGSNGNPDREALVVVFPADPSGWSDFGPNPRRLRSARPGKDGAFTFTGLPAGEYYLAAIREDAMAQWQDLQTLETLSRSASMVRVADGETRTQDVRTAGGPR